MKKAVIIIFLSFFYTALTAADTVLSSEDVSSIFSIAKTIKTGAIEYRGAVFYPSYYNEFILDTENEIMYIEGSEKHIEQNINFPGSESNEYINRPKTLKGRIYEFGDVYKGLPKETIEIKYGKNTIKQEMMRLSETLYSFALKDPETCSTQYIFVYNINNKKLFRLENKIESNMYGQVYPFYVNHENNRILMFAGLSYSDSWGIISIKAKNNFEKPIYNMFNSKEKDTITVFKEIDEQARNRLAAELGKAERIYDEKQKCSIKEKEYCIGSRTIYLSDMCNDTGDWGHTKIICKDQKGTAIWDKEYMINKCECPAEAIAAGQDSMIIAGTHSQHWRLGTPRFIYIMKINTEGNTRWIKSDIRGRANSIIKTKNHEYLLCGKSESNDGGGVLVIKFDDAGNNKMEKSI